MPAWPKIVFAAALVIHALMFPSLFFGYLDGWFDNSDEWPRGIDFYSIYQGGTFFLRGDSIYNWTAADSVPYAAPYRYLPFFAYTGGAALNILPAKAAYWVWVVCIEAMAAANAWATYRTAPDKRWGLVAAGTWYAFTPLYLELYMGQWSFLMATLMFWTILLLHRGQPQVAGLPWILSVLIKTNSALLGAIFLRLRQWRVLVAGGVAVVVLNAPYFLWRPDDWSFFLRANFGSYYRDSPGRSFLTSAGDVSGLSLLRSCWFALDETAQDLPMMIERPYVLGIVGLSFAATMLPRRPDVIVQFATWLAVFFLVYITWEHHYVMLLPPLALLIALRPQYRAVALGVFVCCALPTPYWLFERFLSDRPPGPLLLNPENYWPAWASIVYHAAKPVPLFGLWCVLVADQLQEWIRERRTGTSHVAISAGIEAAPPLRPDS